MTAASADLQKAMFAALTGNAALVALMGGARIFDRAPTDAAFPFVTFGRTSVFDWSTSTEDGLEHLVTLHVWSKAKGRKEAFAVLDAVRAALGTPLSLDDQHLVNFRFEFSEVTFDDDISVHHGLLRLRAVTESAV
ncbi:hypothetical protein HNR59_001665 [Aquamicrobium lusatiense]|uniref:DUF3168 domain-containing protein n=1 Tax=Aquamicrobium lusatiense TaxID=89772 RepID=A0A7W9S1Q9_9HYPH|nr:DUF3168 domain-containing protein [Aquamicrobium lusatiense]MBB6012320.1 hypothetical protein [Aquamicrobium lusatiense]